MIKHIVGFLLFSFIVATSSVISGMLYGTAERSVIEEREVQSRWYSEGKRKKKKRKCRRHRHPHDYGSEFGFSDPVPENAGVKITEFSVAYFPSSNSLETRFEFDRDPDPASLVDLHFFVKDENGVRYLKTESIQATNSRIEEVHKFEWLETFQQKRNLYVIAKLRSDSDSFTSPPLFEESNALRFRFPF